MKSESYQKYLNLCSEDEWRSYGFGTTWGWVINNRIVIFGCFVHKFPNKSKHIYLHLFYVTDKQAQIESTDFFCICYANIGM